MFRKIAFALAATATLGLASLAGAGSAEAKPFGYHKHHSHFAHHHFYRPRFIAGPVVYAYGGGGCYVKRWVATPWGMKLRWVNRCF